MREFRSIWALTAFVVAALGACDCAGKRLVIVEPEHSASLGAADDLDAVRGGLQREVLLDATGLAIGETVEVHVTTDGVVADDDFIYYGAVAPDRSVTVLATLPEGTSVLVACAGERCHVRSPKVTVDVSASVGVCPLVQFVNPRARSTDTFTLTAEDDSALDDGTCGEVFAVPVRARVEADDGTSVTLYLDGRPTAQSTVMANVADFGDVVLGVRGADVTRMHLEIDGFAGRCPEALAAPIAVDCPGSTCALTAPDAARRFLNSGDDARPDTAGLQLDVVARSAVGGIGRDFRLIVPDGARTLATTAAASAAGASVATFSAVPLAEGPVAFAAVCTDGTAPTRSATARYVVDTVGCTMSLDAPTDGRVFTTADDADRDATNGIQLDGKVTAPNCDDFRIAVCSSLASTVFAPLSTSSIMRFSLGTAGPQEVCGEVRDVAGNVTRKQVLVGAAPGGAPQLAVVVPAAGASVSRDGGSFGGVDHLADVLRSTPTCELDVTVDCSGIGSSVSLLVDGGGTRTAACSPNVRSSLGGRATFSAVVLPLAPLDHSLVARQTVAGLSGASMPISVSADCKPPTVAITSPTCGGYVGPDDDVGAAAGIQVPVVVSSPNTPQVDVSVAVVTAAGTSTVVTSPASSLPPGATEHTFAALDVGGAGTARLVATGIDAFGNTAVTAACPVTVTGLPTLALDPLPTTTFNAANQATYDCAPGGGLDLRVSGTTNATNGSTVTLTIGAGAPILTSVSAGRFSACVPAPEGTSEVRASVDDTVFTDGVAGTASAVPVVITVQTAAPLGAIEPVRVTILDRRAARARFDFTALANASGGSLSSYELKCAPQEILTEAAYGAATRFDIGSPTPASPGSPDSVQATGFFTGTTAHCTLRGYDGAGNRTALPSAGKDAVVAPAFLVARFDGPIANGSAGIAGARAVGDVDGDGQPDFVVSGSAGATLYFGRPAGQLPVLGVQFTQGASDRYFGSVVRGIGDFDGDGIDDLAIGDPGASAFAFDGQLYVFFGRRNWRTSFQLSETGCAASFCVRGWGRGGSLAWDVAGLGDFDGRPGDDVAVASPTSNEVFILSGRSGIPPRTEFLIGTNDPVGFRVIAPVVSGSFGWTLGAPGNVSGTSHADLVIGQVGQWPPGTDVPSVLYRVNGRPLAGSATGFTDIPASQLALVASDTTLSSNFGTADLQGIAFADYDADGIDELLAFSIDSVTTPVGAWVLYGSPAADYPVRTGLRVTDAASSVSSFAFGLGRGFASDPNFGPVGDLNLDRADELLFGGVTATANGNHSVALLYGAGSRRTGTFDANLPDLRTAVLAPAVEALPRSSPYPYWFVGFPGDVVQDSSTRYPDLLVLDPGTFDVEFPREAGRFFLLY